MTQQIGAAVRLGLGPSQFAFGACTVSSSGCTSDGYASAARVCLPCVAVGDLCQ